MCLAQGPQRSDAGEARTRGPSVSSQALYHWATALPNLKLWTDILLWVVLIELQQKVFQNYLNRSLDKSA